MATYPRPPIKPILTVSDSIIAITINGMNLFFDLLFSFPMLIFTLLGINSNVLFFLELFEYGFSELFLLFCIKMYAVGRAYFYIL